jgi:hypothetical protein
MPIRPFLRDAVFTPEQIAMMSRAFEQAVASLAGCDETTRRAMATVIIAAARAGERDVAELARLSLLAAAPLPAGPEQSQSGHPPR